MQSQEFLTPLVEDLRVQLGAEAVLSFFPSHGRAARKALLAKAGESKRVSELGSASRVASLVATIVRGEHRIADMIESGKSQSPIIVLEGKEPNSFLLAFSPGV